MKKVTCAMLGGPSTCSVEFTGETFTEVGNQSKSHAMEMFKNNDQPHKDAMNIMMTATPDEQMKMMKDFEDRFNSAPTV